MTEHELHDLGWLTPIWEVLPDPPACIIEPADPGTTGPTYDYGELQDAVHLLRLPERGERDESWRQELGSVLSSQEGQCFFLNAMSIPSRAVRLTLDSGRCSGPAALIAAAFDSVGPGGTLCCLAPLGVLSDVSSRSLRAHIAAYRCLRWIVYFGADAAKALGAHPGFRMVVVVLQREMQPESGETLVVRLVDLASLPLEDWGRALRQASRRGGGEAGPVNVLRDPALDDQAWTFERFSQHLRRTLSDLEELGALRPLADYVHSIAPGPRLKNSRAHLVVPGSDGEDAGGVPCFSGRSVSAEGRLTSARYLLDDDAVEGRDHLQPGDVVIRPITPPYLQPSQLVYAVVGQNDLPATVDHTLLRLRWNDDVGPEARELLTAYLGSRHAAEWVRAHLTGLHLTPYLLCRLPVPEPRAEVMEALAGLKQAESAYLEWATAAHAARDKLFAAGSFRDAIPEIIESTSREQERLRAASDSQTFDYRVRNYFPHPIALRRENILQMGHGQDRLEATLECAEHLMVLLALMAMVQQQEQTGCAIAAPERFVEAAQDGRFHLSWGLCREVLREGLALTRKHENPLTLPFPELVNLADAAEDPTSPWARSETAMRGQRNRQAHLERRPASEVAQQSEEHQQHLDSVLEGVDLLAAHTLVYVEDYVLNPASLERTACFRLLQGSSTAFRREQRPVLTELARETMGLLTSEGEFYNLYPWVIREICPVCKRLEVFVFNRLEGHEVTYVAMETGHSHEKPELVDQWRRLLLEVDG